MHTNKKLVGAVMDDQTLITELTKVKGIGTSQLLPNIARHSSHLLRTDFIPFTSHDNNENCLLLGPE